MMKKKIFDGILTVSLGIVSIVSCQNIEGNVPEFDIAANRISFVTKGRDSGIAIAGTHKRNISNSASSWLQLSKTMGNKGYETIGSTTAINSTGNSSSAVLIVSSSSSQSKKVTISQSSLIYPSYNTSPKDPDETGMSSTAVRLAAKMKLGWNIGNTFEAPGGETGWGSPVITEAYIKFLKQCGFNAIRIPCAWNWYHVDNKQTAHIDENWLNRVKEVVGYCVNNDMYVLLNVHWDGGWLENNCTKARQDSVNAKQKAIWEQIATTMRDFDEHLMFASANEPNAENAGQMEILTTYHQTFIDAVRSTGGRNSYRVLVVQGPCTDMEKTYNLMNNLPKDQVANRMMVEVHSYSPYQFCLMNKDENWGKMFYYWGTGHHSTIEPDRNPTWGEEDDLTNFFEKMKEKFVDKGIPVILGEYGTYRRGGSDHAPLDLATHNDAVDYWITFVTKQTLLRGIIPFFWDTGGVIDRSNNSVKDRRTIDALKAGAK